MVALRASLRAESLIRLIAISLLNAILSFRAAARNFLALLRFSAMRYSCSIVNLLVFPMAGRDCCTGGSLTDEELVVISIGIGGSNVHV